MRGNDRRILVFYLGVGQDMNNNDVERYVMRVKKNFFSNDFLKNNNCEVIIIPNRNLESKIECINPLYVTDEELIKEHENLMKEFNSSLNNFIVDQKE